MRRAGVSAEPDEPAADRAPHFELVADHDLVVEERGHLASGSRSTVSSISGDPSGADATE